MRCGDGEIAMRRSCVIVWIALASPGLGAEPPIVKSAAPTPHLDAVFERADGCRRVGKWS
jgi:hypothetical protein